MPIQVVQSFTASSRVPCCSVCGNDAGKTNPNDSRSADRPVLVLADIDMEGTFDICWSCAEQIGETVGMDYPERCAVLSEAWDAANAKLDIAAEVVAASQLAVAAVSTYITMTEDEQAAQARADGYAQGVSDAEAAAVDATAKASDA